ncbi:uncharacterized protein LOC126392747 isoform X2 [Epinephelus moara]|uniref:uncharacterized protein LOC126392747 isoform X2 n=1 Tax=Epinephelus moara TaxID=300413 RepID=UPI00214F548D|nr:uncharacterized protein LOC126392747 isoform X2 [Epinephelus moara]XP_049904306.1 uncharacterized protein LOC126392747 isoform X2 [Epinephelus moara]
MINVLFASDLAFTSPILAGADRSTALAVRGARHRGRRFRRFTPRQRGRGEQGPRGWNTSSGPTTGTSQASTGSSECREIKRRGTAPYSVQEAVEVLAKQAFSLTSRPLCLPRRWWRLRRRVGAGARQRMSWVRAVWQEKKRQEEGTAPDTWVDMEAKIMFWPCVSNAVKHLEEWRKPKDGWRKFPLIKVKMRSDNFQECEDHDLTSSAEVADSPKAKRPKIKRSYQDCITGDNGGSEGELDVQHEDDLDEYDQGCFSPEPELPVPPNKVPVGSDASVASSRSQQSVRPKGGEWKFTKHQNDCGQYVLSSVREAPSPGLIL